MIVKHVVKQCCGGKKSWIFQVQSPIKKSFIETFEKNGFVTLPHFVKSGLFYIQRGGLVATSSFGSTKVQVRCNVSNMEALETFEKILDELTSVK